MTNTCNSRWRIHPISAPRSIAAILSAMLVSGVDGGMTLKQTQVAIGRPAALDTTWVVTEEPFGPRTFRVQEDGGKLTVTVKHRVVWKNPNSPLVEDSDSVEYDKVNYVSAESDLMDKGGGRRHVEVDDSDGHYVFLTLRTEEEAREFTEYVARKSPLGLELIGAAWRVRRVFQCPEDTLGCEDFKDLLDHGDPEIADYFYSRDKSTHTYACYGDEKNRFFIVQYSQFGEYGTFMYEEFQNQQSGRQEVHDLRWMNESAQITESSLEVRPGAKPRFFGGIDESSLSYATKFTNRENSTTDYSLDVRWSTGRYTESFAGKDKKSEPWNFDKSGTCTKLN